MAQKPKQQPPAFDPRLRYPVDEATYFLKYSRAQLYKDIQAGSIRTIREGKRVFIPGTEIARKCAIGNAA